MILRPTALHSRHPALRLLAGTIGGLLLASCANMPPRSVKDLPPTEYKALERTGSAVAEESAKLATQQDKLREQIERAAPTAVAVAPVAPAYDPRENSVVSISMYDAARMYDSLKKNQDTAAAAAQKARDAEMERAKGVKPKL